MFSWLIFFFALSQIVITYGNFLYYWARDKLTLINSTTPLPLDAYHENEADEKLKRSLSRFIFLSICFYFNFEEIFSHTLQKTHISFVYLKHHHECIHIDLVLQLHRNFHLLFSTLSILPWYSCSFQSTEYSRSYFALTFWTTHNCGQQ